MEIINEKREPKRLFRSRSKRVLGGVCGGLADYLNVDVTVIRVAFIFLFFCPFPTLIPYLIMWLVVPEEA